MSETGLLCYDAPMLHVMPRATRLAFSLFVVLLLTGCLAPAPAAPVSDAPDAAVYPREAQSLPAIHDNDLPPEARETLRLIDQGGPFPYDQDGQTFENRERILPGRPTGYYREYTVETPGSGDRGARRIVAGKNGERYYTDDHYDSFSRVAP